MKPGRKRKTKVTLPGANGRRVETVLVADPYDTIGKRVEVSRAVNHSPLDYMLARDRLHGANETREDGEARHLAGTRLQGLYERAGGAGARAIDYQRVKVDTSLHYAGTPEAQAVALKELGAIRAEVGETPYRMLHAICCEQIPFFKWLGKEYGQTSRLMAGRDERRDAYQALRDALDSLVNYFGVAVGKPSQIRAFHVKQFTGEENTA